MPTQEKPLSASEQQELDSLVAKIEVAYWRKTKADRMGLMWLREIHDRRLYRGHGSFAKFVQEKFCGKSRQWAWHKLIQIEVIENLEPLGITYITESKAKVLRPFSAEDQRAIAREAGKTPLKIWKEIATDHAMAIAGERYSPHWLAQAARRVMEKIDTDPASCGAANKTIGAKQYFDQDKDGLTRKWHGATYLNPPFGPGWKDWIVKLAEEIEAGRVTEAVVVGPHTMLVSIDSPWFRILLEGSIFLPEQRPRFSEGSSGKETGVKYGTFVAYVGKRHRRFARVLGNQGIILRAVSTRPAKRRVVS